MPSDPFHKVRNLVLLNGCFLEERPPRTKDGHILGLGACIPPILFFSVLPNTPLHSTGPIHLGDHSVQQFVISTLPFSPLVVEATLFSWVQYDAAVQLTSHCILSHSVGPCALAPVLGGEKSLIVICKLSAPSTLQVTSKARRLLGPNLDLEEEDDKYEPDSLTEEEEQEEDADVDPDAPSWEVGPEAGEGIFERMTTTVSKCQPSIAPLRRHPNGVTPTSDAGIGKTVTSPATFATNHFLPKANAILTRGGNHLQKVKAAWIGPEGTVIGSVPPRPAGWRTLPRGSQGMEGQQEQEAHPNPNSPIVNYEEGTSEEEAQNKAKAQEEEEESEEEGHNKTKGQEPYPYKIFSTTINYYEQESEGKDQKGTTNFDQKGKRKAIIIEDEDEEDEDVNIDVDMDIDLDVDVDVDEDEDEDDEDEQEQKQEWEQEHEWEQEQEQEQEEPPSGFLYHPYLDTINLKVNWEFRFLICEVCKEAIKKQDVIGHVKTHKLKVDPSQLAKATDQLKVVSDFPTIKEPHLPVKGLPLHNAFACYCSSYLGIYIYNKPLIKLDTPNPPFTDLSMVVMLGNWNTTKISICKGDETGLDINFGPALAEVSDRLVIPPVLVSHVWPTWGKACMDLYYGGSQSIFAKLP
ncbi:hypothetical protein EDC04DRAFT_2610907 [Pisolithus marmoratus]|nr:hypothetical protein EDC04DRAFT_2610907 [Pisolithus marmoratus]